jgi:hypothetical protein
MKIRISIVFVLLLALFGVAFAQPRGPYTADNIPAGVAEPQFLAFWQAEGRRLSTLSTDVQAILRPAFVRVIASGRAMFAAANDPRAPRPRAEALRQAHRQEVADYSNLIWWLQQRESGPGDPVNEILNGVADSLSRCAAIERDRLSDAMTAITRLDAVGLRDALGLHPGESITASFLRVSPASPAARRRARWARPQGTTCAPRSSRSGCATPARRSGQRHLASIPPCAPPMREPG